MAALLRTRTAPAHLAAEQAFDLDARLASRACYTALLTLLRAFYLPLETALAGLSGWELLTPAVDLSARGRAALLDDDLLALGSPVPPQVPAQGTSLPVLRSLAQGLGCLYVLEGSALGGRIVARQARAALGPDLPVAFFTNPDGPRLGVGWPALQATLDAYGRTAGEAAVEAAVLAAEQTFAALGDRLGPAPGPVGAADRSAP